MKMANNSDDIVSQILAAIAILYVLASLFSGLFSKKRKPKQPPREPLREREEEEEEEIKPKRPSMPPPPAPALPVATHKEPYEFHSKLDDFQQRSAIDERKLTIHLRSPEELVSESLRAMSAEGYIKKKKRVPIQEIIKNLPIKQALFISYEVFNLPVSRRKTPFPWNG